MKKYLPSYALGTQSAISNSVSSRKRPGARWVPQNPLPHLPPLQGKQLNRIKRTAGLPQDFRLELIARAPHRFYSSFSGPPSRSCRPGQSSRQFIEASAQEPERFPARRLVELELLIIYLNGLVFGKYHVICAVGVDSQGKKYVLGVAERASENAGSVTSLLKDLVARWVDPKHRYLLVIDGSKVLLGPSTTPHPPPTLAMGPVQAGLGPAPAPALRGIMVRSAHPTKLFPSGYSRYVRLTSMNPVSYREGRASRNRAAIGRPISPCKSATPGAPPGTAPGRPARRLPVPGR